MEHVKIRIQTAPLDKITTDFWRSQQCLHDSELPKAKKHRSICAPGRGGFRTSGAKATRSYWSASRDPSLVLVVNQ